MMRKVFNSLFGFGAGIFAAPLAFLAWPFLLAVFMFNETED